MAAQNDTDNYLTRLLEPTQRRKTATTKTIILWTYFHGNPGQSVPETITNGKILKQKVSTEEIRKLG